MPAVVLALGSALTWGTGDFLSGLMSRRVTLLVVLLISQGSGVPLMALLVWARGTPPPGWGFIPLAALAGITGQLGLGALYRGMAIGTISIVAPISATGAALPVLYGLLTGERPTVVQGIGVGLALLGVTLVSQQPRPAQGAPTPPHHDGSAHWDGPEGAAKPGREAAVKAVGHQAKTSILYALGSAVSFGVFYLALGAAGQADPLWAVLIQRSAALPCLLIVSAIARPSFGLGWRPALILLAGGTLDLTANVLYADAYAAGLGGLSAVLASLYPIATISLALLVLRERVTWLQGLGIASALGGITLIAWR